VESCEDVSSNQRAVRRIQLVCDPTRPQLIPFALLMLLYSFAHRTDPSLLFTLGYRSLTKNRSCGRCFLAFAEPSAYACHLQRGVVHTVYPQCGDDFEHFMDFQGHHAVGHCRALCDGCGMDHDPLACLLWMLEDGAHICAVCDRRFKTASNLEHVTCLLL
jgi:hypothetical protein